eukprot:1830300-Prymnesium_polylepis.1
MRESSRRAPSAPSLPVARRALPTRRRVAARATCQSAASSKAAARPPRRARRQKSGQCPPSAPRKRASPWGSERRLETRLPAASARRRT